MKTINETVSYPKSTIIPTNGIELEVFEASIENKGILYHLHKTTKLSPLFVGISTIFVTINCLIDIPRAIKATAIKGLRSDKLLLQS